MRELKILHHYTTSKYWSCSIVRIEEYDRRHCQQCGISFISGCIALSLLDGAGWGTIRVRHLYCKNCITSDTEISRHLTSEGKIIHWHGFTCEPHCEALHLTWFNDRRYV